MVKVASSSLALVAAFSAGAAATIGARLALQVLRSTAEESPSASPPGSSVNSLAQGSAAKEQELTAEQLSRIASFFGEDGLAVIRGAFVVVIGVGGVGSHAAHLLARSGVGRLRLVDFDNVTLSSLNRHAVATRADVGTPKVAAMKRHLLQTVPGCEIEALPVMFAAGCADELLEGNPTYVLDCIDDVTTKTALLEAVTDKKLKVITSMGAGGKADPTRIQIGSLKDAVRDPLATKIRYFLKKKGISSADITTVYSSEKSVAKLLPLDPEQAAKPEEFGNVENFRIRVIPVLGTMPALFGQSMAAYVLCDLAGQKFTPEAIARLSRDQRNKLHQKLQQRERDHFKDGKIDIEKDEIEFIYQEIWRGRSAVSGARQGGRERLYLSRWRKERALQPDNIVFLTTKELTMMDEGGIEVFGADAIARIDARLAEFSGWNL